MSKKQDAFYFDSFVACVDHGCKAAELLNDAFHNFTPDRLSQQVDAVHAEEHAADLKKHEMLNVLAKAFITPIEREDIILLSQNIDEIADKIDDVLMRVYCNNVQVIRPDACDQVALLVKACAEVKALMAEFADFKRSKHIRDHIIKINSLEEEADRLYITCLRTLHTTATDPLVVLAWHEVYSYLEKCMDACEHVADTVETVIMKNT